jgi:hypothetical protein
VEVDGVRPSKEGVERAAHAGVLRRREPRPRADHRLVGAHDHRGDLASAIVERSALAPHGKREERRAPDGVRTPHEPVESGRRHWVESTRLHDVVAYSRSRGGRRET